MDRISGDGCFSHVLDPKHVVSLRGKIRLVNPQWREREPRPHGSGRQTVKWTRCGVLVDFPHRGPRGCSCCGTVWLLSFLSQDDCLQHVLPMASLPSLPSWPFLLCVPGVFCADLLQHIHADVHARTRGSIRRRGLGQLSQHDGVIVLGLLLSVGSIVDHRAVLSVIDEWWPDQESGS